MAEVETRTTALQTGSYVEWGAVTAGAVIALAVSFVLLSFGAAVGLSAVSPWTTSKAAATAVSLGAAFWMILVHVWAFSLGGYISGRMRHRWSSVQSEVEFRDGAHGLLVWASAVAVAAVVAAASVTSIGRGTVDAMQGAVRTAGDPLAAQVDTLLRSTRPAPESRSDDIRAEASRLLVSAQGQNATASRAHIVQLVAARTGLSEADADKRVSEVVNDMKQTADKARKWAVISGFLIAATLLVSAAAAWVSAEIGGKHRDEGTLWSGFSRTNLKRRT
jgi:hypothetical protein